VLEKNSHTRKFIRYEPTIVYLDSKSIKNTQQIYKYHQYKCVQRIAKSWKNFQHTPTIFKTKIW
jgi:hypothetical protein